MRPALRPLLVAVTLLPAAVMAQFKWIDADGRVGYGDSPPRDAKKVERIGGASSEASPMAGLPFEVRRAAANFPLTLYTMPNCPACDAARDLLRSRGTPYTELTVTTAEDQAAFRKLDYGDRMPVLQLGRQTLREFAPEAWHSSLDSAGYPRSAVLPSSWRNPAPRALAPAPAAPAAAGQPAAN
jgi:glutaredoxin